MARPCLIPKDPIIYQKVLTALALGVSTRLIADWLGVGDSTIRNWKRHGVFKRDYHARLIDTLIDPIQIMRVSKPDIFLQTHPETREDWAPPTQKSETKNQHEITCLKIEFISPKPEDNDNDSTT